MTRFNKRPLFPCLLSLFAFGFSTALFAQSDPVGIGSGAPGMKVCIAPSRAIAIYQDEPSTVGEGLLGGMSKRHIQVLFDPSHTFNQDAMDIPQQLYPLDPNSAFTCSGGKWDSSFGHWMYEPRVFIVYSLNDGKLVVEHEAQQKAQARFGLKQEEVFLGQIDGRVFFWKKFDPHRIYWRSTEGSPTFSIKMPKGIIDIYGVTRGIKMNVGAVVFRSSPGFFHYAPYTHDFVEFRLSDGTETHEQ